MTWTLDDMLKLTQIISYAIAVPVAAFSVWKHFAETSEKRIWEKAKFARDMVADLDKNEKALAATYMLGEFENRKYQIDDSKTKVVVTQEDVRKALSKELLEPSPKQEFIRDCFDNFLFHLEQWLLASKHGLVEESQLRPLLLTLLAGIQQTTGQAVKGYAELLQYHEAASALDGLVNELITPNLAFKREPQKRAAP